MWGLVVAIIVKLEAHYSETASSFGHHRENNFVASHKLELITLTMCAKNKYVALKKNKTTLCYYATYDKISKIEKYSNYVSIPFTVCVDMPPRINLINLEMLKSQTLEHVSES